MKRIVSTILGLVLAGLGGHAAMSADDVKLRVANVSTTFGALPAAPLQSAGVTLGIYDPSNAFSGDHDVRLEHMFVYWQALDLKDFRTRLRYAQERNRTIMVTVEPYTKAPNWRDGGDHLFSDILSDRFQQEIANVCIELGKVSGPVMVRWGHEMEDPTGRYPWARSDDEGFKAAFRHFVKSCREYASNTTFVWSPKGEKNLEKYYPGDAYVDYVGVSLWGLQAMDMDFYGGSRNFQATFSEKYERVSHFDKPVIIAELGVSGDKVYRDRWFKNLFDTIADPGRFPQLQAVVYFNDKEPYYWPMGYGSPDWRVPAGWFSGVGKTEIQISAMAR